jgi:hypothetical protein
MKPAARRGGGAINEGVPQTRMAGLLEIKGGVKGHVSPAHRMLQLQRRRVQTDSLVWRAAVKLIAQDGKAEVGGMRANLVRAAGQGPGLHQNAAAVFLQEPEGCFGRFGSGMKRSAGVFFADPSQAGFGGHRGAGQGAMG